MSSTLLIHGAETVISNVISELKGSHKQDKKTTLRMGENICKRSNWQGINLPNIQTAHAAQYQKNKQPNP